MSSYQSYSNFFFLPYCHSNFSENYRLKDKSGESDFLWLEIN